MQCLIARPRAVPLIQKLVFLSFVFLLIFQTTTLADKPRPKIGLVLSGGGARGFAHIGTLRMIDSLKIPIDYIAGTSMGGIVGALYAIGYDAVEIENIVRAVDWEQMLTDDPPRDLLPYIEKWDDGLYQMELGVQNFLPTAPSGLIAGQRISLLLSKLTFAFDPIDDFDQLPIPFRCVAVDLITGREVILKDGSLAKAMRSTMSIPSLFYPVEYGDSLLIDGGLLNNLPVDVATQMGSEVVIAVNVGRPKRKKDELDNLFAILEQSITIPGYFKEDANIKNVNLLINPNLSKLSNSDFSTKNVAAIIAEGYRSAQARLSDFKKLIDVQNLSSPRSRFEAKQEPSLLQSIKIAGNSTIPSQYIYSNLGLNPGDSVNYTQLQDSIRSLRADGHLSKVDYQVDVDENDDLYLRIRVKEMNMPMIYGIEVLGNQSLSFGYIYNMLRMKPGDILNIEHLENKLMELYSLGYFDTVNYSIEPVNKDQIKLIIQLKEKPQNRLNLGFHYNNFHHLVGHLSYLGQKTFIPGLRLQTSLEFAGLTHLTIKALYPYGRDGFVLYPYLQAEYVNKPLPINDLEQTIALYNDQYTNWGLGIGFWPNKSTQFQLGLERQLLNVYPEIGMTGLPKWEHDLVKITLSLNIDWLDQVLIPTAGWKLTSDFDLSSTIIGSDIDFHRYEIILRSYRQVSRRVNLSFHVDFGEVSGAGSENYLWYHTGGPNSFVGIDYYRLSWSRVANFRFDYRYKWQPDLYIKAIYNIAPNFNWLKGEKFYPFKENSIQGLGVGILYDSILGPIELIYSRGDNKLDVQKHFQNTYVYFTAGVHF
ncbi:MAG: patatin-like phospholipase family protein [Candidatus Marinimicrobia bacterium]|nr:patatin-like phospholipase family protein [Candidatus Neomarinimicrobiota bacterium]